MKFFFLSFNAISLVADNENPYSIIKTQTAPRILASPIIPMPSTRIVLARNGSNINEIK